MIGVLAPCCANLAGPHNNSSRTGPSKVCAQQIDGINQPHQNVQIKKMFYIFPKTRVQQLTVGTEHHQLLMKTNKLAIHKEKAK